MDSTDLVDLKIDKKVGKLKYYFKVSNLLKVTNGHMAIIKT